MAEEKKPSKKPVKLKPVGNARGTRRIEKHLSDVKKK